MCRFLKLSENRDLSPWDLKSSASPSDTQRNPAHARASHVGFGEVTHGQAQKLLTLIPILHSDSCIAAGWWGVLTIPIQPP